MRKFRELLDADRPREKLQSKGAVALSDTELLAVLIGTGTSGSDVLAVSREVSRLFGSSAGSMTLDRLASVAGVGPVKASQILAAMEWTQRRLLKAEAPVVADAAFVAHFARDLRGRRQEHFQTLTLDGAHRLIRHRTVFIGTLTESLVHPREVFADAVEDRAAGLILVHNHPSGRVEPSEEDVRLTARLTRAGELLGIPVLDHVIVAADGYYSFQEGGRLVAVA